MGDRITFQVADAQQLPFRDRSFDVVISESVTAFVPDTTKAVSEFHRVLKPDGRVGMTEVSWVKTPPPAPLVDFLSRTMDGAVFLEPEGWVAMLEHGGFIHLQREVFHLTARDQLASDLSGQSWRDMADRFRAMGAFVRQYLTDPQIRRYSKSLMPSRQTIRDLFTYFGYGIYTGTKAP